MPYDALLIGLAHIHVDSDRRPDGRHAAGAMTNRGRADQGGPIVRALTLILALVAGGLTAGTTAVAQEGHPLKGSWIGEWGPAKTHSNDLLVVINWDGKAITGIINPGTDNISIKSATLVPEGWLVRIEADAKETSGALLSYTLEGTIENLALASRSISGTWKNQRESGKFTLVRQ
jgi:hypothetical protein